MKLNINGHPVTREDVGEMIPAGWKTLVLNLVDELEKMGWNGNLQQVKEKFGGLRFYASYETDLMGEAIERAEVKSYRICQDCGKEGDDVKDHQSRRSGWVVSLCHDCNQKEIQRLHDAAIPSR